MRSKANAGVKLLLAVVVAFGLHSGVAWSQSAEPGIEVKLEGADFTQVKDRLFGAGGLLNQTQPFEFKAEGLVLTQQQAQDFFFPAPPAPASFTTPSPPASSTPTQPTDFTALIQGVQQRPGSEAKLQGTVNGIPFEAKVEGGEVKIEGLSLTQSQFTALVSRLQGTTGVREFKVEAVVDGKLMEAKFENEGGRIRTRVEASRSGRSEERRHRGESGTSADLNSERARDMGRDLDHSLRGRDRAELERIERSGRSERIERSLRPERIERSEGSGRRGRD